MTTETTTDTNAPKFRLPTNFRVDYEKLRLLFDFEGKSDSFPIENTKAHSNGVTTCYVVDTKVPEKYIESWAIRNQLLLREYKAAVAEIDGYLGERVEVATPRGRRIAVRRELVTRAMQSFKPLDTCGERPA